MRSHKLFLLVGAGVAPAVLFYFGTGLHPIWGFLWLAPIPVLAVAPRLHGGAAFCSVQLHGCSAKRTNGII
jgi:apolipoprotein N-acyltransferase